jgi:hypothetical protein
MIEGSLIKVLKNKLLKLSAIYALATFTKYLQVQIRRAFLISQSPKMAGATWQYAL